MKKVILFILVFAYPHVSAQRQSKSWYKAGFKLGVGAAKITGDKAKGSSRITFQGGGWCQIRLSKNWTAQTEAIYIEKGIDGHFKGQARFNGYALSLMYIEFPVLFQYHNKKSTFETGPGMGVLIYQYESLYGLGMPNMTAIYPFKTQELSYNIGYGYSINEKWNFSLRFSHSLLPVRKEIPNFSRQIYNRIITISFAHQIKFKKSKIMEAQDIE